MLLRHVLTGIAKLSSESPRFHIRFNCCRCGMKLSEHASLNGMLKEAELVDIMGQVRGQRASV